MIRYDKMYLIEITNSYIYNIAMYSSSVIAQTGVRFSQIPCRRYTASLRH
jgi:hypothetical protein